MDRSRREAEVSLGSEVFVATRSSKMTALALLKARNCPTTAPPEKSGTPRGQRAAVAAGDACLQRPNAKSFTENCGNCDFAAACSRSSILAIRGCGEFLYVLTTCCNGKEDA